MSVPLSRRQLYRLTALSGMGVTLLGGLIWIAPLITDYQARLSDLDQARAGLPPATSLAHGLPPLTLRLERLKQELAQTRQTFPVAETVSTLLVQLESLATNRVAVEEVYPTKLVPVKLPKQQAKTGIAVSEQLMELVAEGPYQALTTFLGRLESLPHPVGVHSVLLERLADQGPRPIGRTPAPLTPVDRLQMKVTLSAYLLDHAVPDVPLFNQNFKDQYEQGQTTSGVVNPFGSLAGTIPLPELPATPSLRAASTIRPIVLPPLPTTSDAHRPSSRSSGWLLVGVLYGSEHTAILTKSGQGPMTIQVGDPVDDWKVVAIEPRAVVLGRGSRRERIELPDRAVQTGR